MNIAIAERLRPFSHAVGTRFLVPGTSWCVRVFPTRLEFSDLEGKGEPFFLLFDFEGPIKEFTAELDLEQSCLCVFGKTRKGFMRYTLCVRGEGVELTMEKTPLDKVGIDHSLLSERFFLCRGESKQVCGNVKHTKLLKTERLSLGMHKAQDWDLMCRRLDCKEIFPHWFRLSGLSAASCYAGDFHLLEECRKKIEQRNKEQILEAFEHLFLAAFGGLLVPRLFDSDHQGLTPHQTTAPKGISPMPLLVESGKLIRSLFVQEDGGVISLLPCLPTQLHCGRFVGVKTASSVRLDIEWSKKVLKRVVIVPEETQQLYLQLPKGIRSCRVVRGPKVQETIIVDSSGQVSLPVESNKTIQLDRLLY
jgi:hypothetical protein